jgi:integrase
MNSNPIDNASPIRGRRKEKIVAIRRHADLKEMIDAIDDPYWKTWVAFAMLAGPRFSEQVYAEKSHVLLDQGYALIYSRKTGRERRVPIERTILKPILESYVPTVTTRWLFPNLLGESVVKRKLTPEVVWSSNKNWAETWEKVQVRNPEAYYWSHGPKEWRHSFGTALGHVGKSSVEISHLMGNSPNVAMRFYVAPTNSARWPLEW